jgi:TonB family protein
MYSQRVVRFAALICAALALHVDAQNGEQAAVPQDPGALFALGLAKNGLHGADVKPWHIRGRYTIYDDNGQPGETGVYEEWWASPTRYKRSFTSEKLAQTEYANGSGLFREGSQDWAWAGLGMRRSLVDPVPELPQGVFRLKEHGESAKGTKFTCVSLTYRLPGNLIIPDSGFREYCFDRSVAALRLTSSGNIQTAYNQFVSLQGRYVARDVRQAAGNKPIFDLSLDVVEGIDVANTFPSVPADAKPVDLTAILLPDYPRVAPMLSLRIAFPDYPGLAQPSGVQGTVVLGAMIEKDGHVDNISVVSGPPELQQAVIDAESQWLYEPLEVFGEARAVKFQVSFTLRHGSN